MDPGRRLPGPRPPGHNEDGEQVATAATNNLLLDLRVVRRLALRFDDTLGLAGGEDTVFTTALTQAGERIVWSREAWVSDERPVDRLTRTAVVRRAFGHANASSGAAIRLAPAGAPRVGVRARAGLGGMARVGAGTARGLLGVATRSRPRRAGGVRLAARGVGMLTSALGYRFEEYRESS